MTTNIINAVPFLRTSRNFPLEAQPLAVEVNRSYIDIANAVNSRTIGLFPTNRSAITGESWFYAQDRRQQTLRQVYLFTAAGSIPHNINVATIAGFTRIYGTFTDGSVWYPLPYVDVVAANNQVNIRVTATSIVIAAGGGTPPAITSGFVVLEWLSNV
jgi:hypothetical protein